MGALNSLKLKNTPGYLTEFRSKNTVCTKVSSDKSHHKKSTVADKGQSSQLDQTSDDQLIMCPVKS